MKKTMVLAILLALLAGFSQAAKVGLVVDFPDGSVHVECLNVGDGDNGYNVLRSADLNTRWAGPGTYGHSLCKIDDIGNTIGAGGCWDTENWAFWIMLSGSGSWVEMPVGHDGGSSCWNRDTSSWDGHYCATDGDVIGYVYGEYICVGWDCDAPPMQTRRTYAQICGGGGRNVRIPKIMELNLGVGNNQTTNQTNIIKAGEGETISFNLTDQTTGKGMQGALVEVFDGTPGVSPPIHSLTVGKDGLVEFQIEKRGQYEMRITANKYPHNYMKIIVETTTTTTTSTTTSTTTTTAPTTTTTTTLRLPQHINLQQQTTTTTLAEPKIVGAAVAQQKTGKIAELKEAKQGGNNLWDWITALFS